MEQQKILIEKDANEEYASVLFSLSRELECDNLFFAWGYGAKTGAVGTLKCDGTMTGCADGYKVVALNMDGTVATSFKANTVYELRYYGIGATGFGVACYNADGQAVTTYFANATSGNGGLDVRAEYIGLGEYKGDVTAIGFEEGTYVSVAPIVDGWSSRVHVQTDTGYDMTTSEYDYVDVQFSFDGAKAISSLKVWPGTGSYTVDTSGVTVDANTADRTIQILDANGNAASELTANTMYTLRVYLANTSGVKDITKLQISNFTVGAILYFGNVTYGNL